MIGVILMIGGVVGVLFGLFWAASARRRAVVYPAGTVVEQPVRRTEVVDY